MAFMDKVKEGIGSIFQIISEGVFPQIAEGAEIIIKKIDQKIIETEKRILRKMYFLSIIWLGGVFLIFGLFFYLTEFLGWDRALAFFSLGIIIFVIGLLLKIWDLNNEK